MGAVAATGKRRGPMIFLAYVVGAQEANCYVVGDEESREALVIDPGENAPELLEQFREHDLRVTAVLATHHHLDHTGSLHELLDALPDASFYMHELDYPRIAEQISRASARTGGELTPPREPDRFLDHGDQIEAGGRTFTALHCPGHTPGSLCLYTPGQRAGESSGDGPGLIAAIHEHLLTLPGETIVFPGHNQATTIRDEYSLNPFLHDPDLTAGRRRWLTRGRRPAVS